MFPIARSFLSSPRCCASSSQVTVRYYGLYANAHRGKVKKASLGPFPLWMVEDELRPIPSKGWAEMIRKVYEVDPLTCVQCGSPFTCLPMTPTPSG
jgi:hypothetical protein